MSMEDKFPPFEEFYLCSGLVTLDAAGMLTEQQRAEGLRCALALYERLKERWEVSV